MLSEELIDLVCSDKKLRKPRTYRENARRDYLTIARNRRKTSKKSVSPSVNNSTISDVTY
jgi:hypothetical protein